MEDEKEPRITLKYILLVFLAFITLVVAAEFKIVAFLIACVLLGIAFLIISGKVKLGGNLNDA